VEIPIKPLWKFLSSLCEAKDPSPLREGGLFFAKDEKWWMRKFQAERTAKI
jgi:hypothetical protein